MRRAKSIKQIYDEVHAGGYDCVLMTDAPLATALNSMVDTPRLGGFAFTPRQIAGIESSRVLKRTAMNDLEVIGAISEDTGISDLRFIYSEVENIREIRRHTKEVEKHLPGNRARAVYRSYASLPTLDSVMSNYEEGDADAFFMSKEGKVAVVGIEDITIGESLVDPDDPRPLPLIKVDDPAISMTIGINTSPMAGRTKGAKVTARQVKDRLDRELIGNVSLRVLPTSRPDAWEVQGRGELALAILVEQMRREGFELTVGKPQVVTRTIDGKRHEPIERMTIDVPEEYLGAVTQLMAARKGRMETMTNHGTGWVRMEFLIPARGTIGLRTQFLTETRGTGIASAIAEGYEPWAGRIVSRTTGSLVSDRAGAVTAYALIRLEDRGTFFVEPGQETYEGQVVGENPRNEDMDVNVVREKQQTNMRSSTADVFEGLVPPRRLTLEEALEFASDDECVEVTPDAVRIRKVILNSQERFRENARRRRAEA